MDIKTGVQALQRVKFLYARELEKIKYNNQILVKHLSQTLTFDDLENDQTPKALPIKPNTTSSWKSKFSNSYSHSFASFTLPDF